MGQGVRHVVQDPHRIAHWELAFARQLDAQAFAFDVRHDVPQQIACRAGRQQRDDMRMLQRGRELDFAPEPFGIHAGGHLGREHFDDHPAAKRGLVGEEHAAHAATPELALDAVRVPDHRLQTRLEVVHGAPKIALDSGDCLARMPAGSRVPLFADLSLVWRREKNGR